MSRNATSANHEPRPMDHGSAKISPCEVSRRSALRVLGGVVLGAALTLPGIASVEAKRKGKVTQRSFAELLAAQGSTNAFDPPFPDYNGWSTPLSDPPHFAYVDYAGVLAQYLDAHEDIDLGTTVHGTVRQQERPDGRAEVTVRMTTSRAVTWIVKDNGESRSEDPLDFGYRPGELIADRSLDPALGWSRLEVVFTIPTPGTPLPDLGYVFYPGDFPDTEGYQLISYDFRARAFGALRAAFDPDVPDGTRGTAQIVNVGTDLDNPDCYTDPDLELVCWPEEVIVMKPLRSPGRELQATGKQERGTKSAKRGDNRRHGRRGR